MTSNGGSITVAVKSASTSGAPSPSGNFNNVTLINHSGLAMVVNNIDVISELGRPV